MNSTYFCIVFQAYFDDIIDMKNLISSLAAAESLATSLKTRQVNKCFLDSVISFINIQCLNKHSVFIVSMFVVS